MQRVFHSLALALAAAAVLAGGGTSTFAGTPASVGDTVRIEGDDDVVVLLPAPASRIVSLIPALTETLFALGAGDRVVGRTRFDRQPPSVRSIPDVGDGIRPSSESVRALEPDLVVLYTGPDNAGVRGELERAGLTILAVRHNTLVDFGRNVRRLGRATGCEAGAESLLGRIEAGLAHVRNAVAERTRPSVYYDVWPSPPITVGRGSFLDSLLAVAGARNVFRDLSAASPQVSLEAIAARDPDLVLWPVEDGRDAWRTPPARRPGWRAIRAVRSGAVRRVDADLVHRLGPRLAGAAAMLARAVHGPGAIEASMVGDPGVAVEETRTFCRTGAG